MVIARFVEIISQCRKDYFEMKKLQKQIDEILLRAKELMNKGDV